jgi:hypothetical protein
MPVQTGRIHRKAPTQIAPRLRLTDSEMATLVGRRGYVRGLAVLVLHRGGFRDGLIYECDAQVPPGSTLTYESSTMAPLPRATYWVSAETAELPTGEITVIAVIHSEESNSLTRPHGHARLTAHSELWRYCHACGRRTAAVALSCRRQVPHPWPTVDTPGGHDRPALAGRTRPPQRRRPPTVPLRWAVASGLHLGLR